MPDIITALDGPATLVRGAVTYQFPVWTMRELLPLLSKLKEARLTLLRARLKEFAVPKEQAAYQVYLEEAKQLNPYDAHVYFMNANGIDECLHTSLVKGGTPSDAATALLDSLRYEEKCTLAEYVGGVYEKPEPRLPLGGGAKNDGLGLGEGGPVAQAPGLGESPNPT